ncbi:MAG: hypothetical protein IT443_02945, partial [Phycisphaeraceae bacterium]|nr:hypothetical protein [Phycisphaeraceae bacterium]
MSRLISQVKGGGLFEPGEIWLTRAPGRLDVMGGIADYSGSLVCEMALKLAVGAAGQLRNDGRMVCRSGQAGEVEVDLNWLKGATLQDVRAKLDGPRAWARYVVGCAWWLFQNERRLRAMGAIRGAKAAIFREVDHPANGQALPGARQGARPGG